MIQRHNGFDGHHDDGSCQLLPQTDRYPSLADAVVRNCCHSVGVPCSFSQSSFDQDGPEIIHVGSGRPCKQQASQGLEEPVAVIVGQSSGGG